MRRDKWHGCMEGWRQGCFAISISGSPLSILPRGMLVVLLATGSTTLLSLSLSLLSRGSQDNHKPISLLDAFSVFYFLASYPPFLKRPSIFISFRLMFTIWMNFQCDFHTGVIHRPHIWFRILSIACDSYLGVLARVFQEKKKCQYDVYKDGWGIATSSDFLFHLGPK